MKKHRQLIALNLVLVLLLSLFPGVALAAETDTDAAEPVVQVEPSEAAQAEASAEPEPPEPTPEPPVDPTESEEPTPEPPVDPTEPEEPTPEPTPVQDGVHLNNGDTATFTRSDMGEFPKFYLEVDRAGAYMLCFTPPEGQEHTIGSSANIHVYGHDHYDRADAKSITLVMQPGGIYSVRLSPDRVTGDIDGEWSVTLQPADTVELTEGELYQIPDSGVYSHAYDVYSLVLPETGDYLIDYASGNWQSGRVYVCSDDAILRNDYLSSKDTRIISGEAGNRLFLMSGRYHTEGGHIRISRVVSNGAFGAEGDNLSWSFDADSGYLSITGSGSMGSLQEGAPWADLLGLIRQVSIGEGVTDVGDNAFCGARVLNDVDLPDGITRIGDYAFADLSIPLYLSFPDSLTEIGEGAFRGSTNFACSGLPGHLVKIGAHAFENTGIYSFDIPASVTEIGSGALASRNLTHISVAQSSKTYKAEDDVLFTKSGKTLVCFPAQKSGPYVVPDTVLHIAPGALTGTVYLNLLYVPATVRTIGASDNAALSEIHYGGTAAQWQKLAAASSMDLSGISVVFEADASSASGIPIDIAEPETDYEVSYTAPSSGVYAITSVNPNGVRDSILVGSYPTSDANLSLYVSDDNGETTARLRGVPGYSGYYDYDSENTVSAAVYYLDGAQDYSLRVNLSRAGYYQDSKLGTWKLGVQKLPAKTLSPGDNALSAPAGGRAELHTFTADEAGWYSFSTTETNYQNRNYLYVWRADGQRGSYSAVRGTYLNLAAGETIVLALANENRAAAETTLTITKGNPHGVCGENAFWSLDENGVLTISGTGAMYDYYQDDGAREWVFLGDSIRKVVVEEGIEYIGAFAFAYLDYLSEVQLADSVRTIWEFAFESCDALREFTIPAGLEEMHVNAMPWTPIRKITVPADNSHFVLENGVLYDSARTMLYHGTDKCPADLTVPDGVREIAMAPFYGNESVRTLRLPHSIEYVGYAPTQNSQIQDIYYDGSAVEWNLIYNDSYPEGLNLHFLRASEAPETTLGSHTETVVENYQRFVYSFTAPESGLYLIRSNGGSTSLFYGDGNAVPRTYLDYFGEVFRLQKGEQIFILLQAYFSESDLQPIEWFMALVSGQALTVGAQTTAFADGETVLCSFTPAETGIYLFNIHANCSLFVYDSQLRWTAGFWGYNDTCRVSLTGGEEYYIVLHPNTSDLSTLQWTLEKLQGVTLEPGENAVVVDGEANAFFTPAETGTYWFRSLSLPSGEEVSLQINDDQGWYVGEDASWYHEDGLLQNSYWLQAGKTYQVILRFSNPDAAGTIRLKISPWVHITSQPQDFYGKVGDTAKFSVSAVGDDLTYEWWYKDPGGDWARSSFKTDTITCRLTAARDGRLYRCIIRDCYGSQCESDEAAIRVVTPPVITSQPQDFAGALGETATFTVAAEGYSLSYRWQYKDVDGTWANASSRTDSTTCKITAARDGRQYRCLIEDGCGNRVTSDAASIIVMTPFAITQQPQSVVGKVGETATFTVAATGDGLTYQWQYQDPGSSTWLNSSFKTDTMSCKLTAARDGRAYRCVVRDQYGHELISDAALITIRTITITQQPQDYIGAVGETATFTVAAEGEGLTYQWEYKDVGGDWAKSSFKTPSLTCKITAARDGRQYRCIVKNASGSVTSEAAAIIVAAPLVITQQPQHFYGKAGATAKFSVAAAGDDLTYRWEYKDVGGDWAKSSFKTPSLTCKITAARDGREYRCIVTDAHGRSITSEAAMIIIGTKLAITSQPQDFSGKVGATAKFSVAATGDGLTYQWQYKDVGGEWANSSFKTSSMTCKITAARDGRQYRCIVTDAHGVDLTSDAATIHVTA